MELTPEHIDILKHTRDRAAGGFYCGDSPAMQELVEEGMMQFAGRKSFVPDPYFLLTSKGREQLKSCELFAAKTKHTHHEIHHPIRIQNQAH